MDIRSNGVKIRGKKGKNKIITDPKDFKPGNIGIIRKYDGNEKSEYCGWIVQRIKPGVVCAVGSKKWWSDFDNSCEELEIEILPEGTLLEILPRNSSNS